MAVSLSLTITESSVNQSANTSVVTAKLYAKSTSGSYNNNSKSGYITIDGTKYTFSHSFKANTSTLLATKSKTVTHNADGSKTVSVKGYYQTGVSSGNISKTVSKTLTKIARQWTVSFNANGGTGAPGNQTKTYGTNLTLSSTVPTKTGYTFNGWNTKADGSGTNYSAGGTYSANAAVTLYAKWTANTYTITYNPNGGVSGSITSQSKTHAQAMTISTSATPTRSGYAFRGWATTATGEAAYAAGASYTAEGNATLYAVWANTYFAPDITNLTAVRCTSNGTEKASDEYIKISFSWAAAGNGSGLFTPTKVKCQLNDGTTPYPETSSNNNSGNVSVIVGPYNLTESPTATIRLTDSTNSVVTTQTIVLPQGGLPVDISQFETNITLFGLADDSKQGLIVYRDIFSSNTLSGADFKITLDEAATAGDDYTLLNLISTKGWTADVFSQGLDIKKLLIKMINAL